MALGMEHLYLHVQKAAQVQCSNSQINIFLLKLGFLPPFLFFKLKMAGNLVVTLYPLSPSL